MSGFSFDFFPLVSLPAPPNCRVCSSELILLVQIYCPLEGSPYHRLFHLFCCRFTNCWNDEKRSQELEEKVANPVTAPAAVSDKPLEESWCDEADDWGGMSDNDNATPIATPLVNVATVTTPSLPIKPNGDHAPQVNQLTSTIHSLTLSTYTGPCYPSFFINVFAESDIITHYGPPFVTEYNTSATVLNTSSGDGQTFSSETSVSTGEKYEPAIAKHGDKGFMKFKKEISKCPNQIIRYLKGGTPLLSSDNYCNMSVSAAAIRCRNCGSSCSFEFQLMPQLVYILQDSIQTFPQESESQQPFGDLKVVEFGGVVVYTCDSSCWSEEINKDNCVVLFREEVVYVYPDD